MAKIKRCEDGIYVNLDELIVDLVKKTMNEDDPKGKSSAAQILHFLTTYRDRILKDV
jgi:hypothetical protein